MVRESDDLPVRSRTNSVIVSNLVSFFDYPLSFGSQMWILAELAVQDADFEVWIHDEDDVPLVGFAGSTTEGFISFIWDLKDGGGNTITNETLDQVFYIFPPGGGQFQPASPPTPSGRGRASKEKQWSDDDFIVAWGESGTQNYLDDFETAMIFGVVSILDDLFREDPYIMSPGNVPYGAAFKLVPQNKNDLLDYIGDPIYRNFFWLGHGNGKDIGYSENIGGERGPRVVSISAKEIRDKTGNRGGRRPHPYRLVFLQACLSAEGGFPTVFGIDEQPRSGAYYVNKGRKASAFVGVKEICGFPAALILQYMESLTEFFGLWMNGADLNFALETAQREQEPGETREPLISELKIFGAQNLNRNGP